MIAATDIRREAEWGFGADERGAFAHEALEELVIATALGRQIPHQLAFMAADRQAVLIQFDAFEIEPERRDLVGDRAPNRVEFGGSFGPFALAIAGDEGRLVGGRRRAHLGRAVDDGYVDQSRHLAIRSLACFARRASAISL